MSTAEALPQTPPDTPRRETLNLRLPAGARQLIDQAARARGVTLTEFVLGAARRAAEEALLDRALISVSPEAYEAFLARLDAPPAPNPRLVETLRSPTPWVTP